MISVSHSGIVDGSLAHRLVGVAERLASIRHDHVMLIREYDYDGDQFMWVVDCPDPMIALDAFLAQKKQVGVSRLLNIFSAICDGLMSCEDAGVVCGSLHPSHLYLDSAMQVRIAPVAISSLILHEVMGEIVDDGIYVAPEWVSQRRVDAVSDRYSFGVLMFEILTGNRPYTASVHVMEMTSAWLMPVTEPFPNPEWPVGLVEVMMSWVQPDPANRVATLADFMAVLAGKSVDLPALEAKREVTDQLAQDLVDDRKAMSRRRARRGAFLAGVAVVVVMGAWFMDQLFMSVPEVTTPNVVGLSLEDAVTQLDAVDMDATILGRRYDPTVPSGSVVMTQPPAGRVVKQSRPVQLMVSRGPEPVRMPQLVGSDWQQASFVVEQLGVSLIEGVPTWSYWVGFGDIALQVPSENMVLAELKTATVNMSKGVPVQLDVFERSDGYVSTTWVDLSVGVLPYWPTQSVWVVVRTGDDEHTVFDGEVAPGVSAMTQVSVNVGDVMEMRFGSKLVWRYDVR